MGLFDGTPLERPVMCDVCGLVESDCRCPPLAERDVPPEKQRLKLRVEKRKRGKIVTVVAGFSGPPAQLQRLLKELKDECGAGGSVEAQQLEIQGDHAIRLRSLLSGRGFKIA